MLREDVEIVRSLYEETAQGRLRTRGDLFDSGSSRSTTSAWSASGTSTPAPRSSSWRGLRASGVPVEREVGDVLTLRDGRIVRFHQYSDRAEALEAAGLRE